jgi:AraC-like DNA-binding protein
MKINHFDIDNGVAGFSQGDYQLKRHAHFPIEIVYSLSGQLNIGTDRHQYTNIQSAIINSNVPHTFSCLNGECQLYFIDPTSHAGKNILKTYLSQGEDMVLNNMIDLDHFKEAYIFPSETKNTDAGNLDSRVQQCINWIKENYSIEGINIAMLSDIVFLSKDRLAHLFKKQVGISIHQYILWRKIEMAIKHGIEGHSLTDCAYSSGFADSSHFIKTFQKMFGIYPSFALK